MTTCLGVIPLLLHFPNPKFIHISVQTWICFLLFVAIKMVKNALCRFLEYGSLLELCSLAADCLVKVFRAKLQGAAYYFDLPMHFG